MDTENNDLIHEEEESKITEKKTNKSKILSMILNIVLVFTTLFLLLRISLLIFFTNIYVTGPSMYPNLKEGEAGYTRKIFNYDSIDRFDIVVINAERFASEDAHWVKRVIALPGETIAYELDEVNHKGILKINGKIVEENFIKGYDGMTKDEITYLTGKINERKLANDEYFVMGDNRGRSSDSRSPRVGHISQDEIFGLGIIITGECSNLDGGTCGPIDYKGIRIEGW